MLFRSFYKMKRVVGVYFLTAGVFATLFLVMNSESGRELLAKVRSNPASRGGSSSSKRLPPKLPPKGSEKVIDCGSHDEPPPCHQLTIDTPTIYFVTPTYPRREQVAELTRLSQTLLHVKNLHWILAEDSHQCSTLIPSILKKYGIPYTHLATPLPSIYTRLPKREMARGVSGRRASLDKILDWHMNRCKNPHSKAVVYFADDDNTYDLQLFEEIRYTEKVSVFPVGFIGLQSVSAPIVEREEEEAGGGFKVVGFTDPWFEKRKFPMAGFAVSVDFIIAQGANASMPYWVGHEEDQFLRSLGVEYRDLEPKANGCADVLVWHTKTVSEKVPHLKFDGGADEDDNLQSLIEALHAGGMAIRDERSGYEVLTCRNDKGCDTRKPIRYTG